MAKAKKKARKHKLPRIPLPKLRTKSNFDGILPQAFGLPGAIIPVPAPPSVFRRLLWFWQGIAPVVILCNDYFHIGLNLGHIHSWLPKKQWRGFSWLFIEVW